MKVPLRWLREFVDITLPVSDLAHILTMAGLEVSAIHHIGTPDAPLPWDAEKIVVGTITAVHPHPNADRLVLADVDVGAPPLHTVVTGAPNLLAYREQPLPKPMKAVFAHEGARIYDGHKDEPTIMTLKGRPVRGVMSRAMLCSEKELGLSNDHEGILFLEDEAPVGTPLVDFLGDVILDIDLTPNLARCLSIVGVAREVAALTGAPLHLPSPSAHMTGPSIHDRVIVTIEDTVGCPRFTATLIEGITIAPSPPWMQRRLIQAGMRPVNNIVDISNYVMLEWGQPSHAFDADCVTDQHFVVRRARPGESLVTLDGKHRAFDALPDPPLLVCDPNGPLGVAGVMGGESSEVSAKTSRILLEAAVWHPPTIRRMAQHLKLPSEASRRFERGVDWEISPIAQHRAAELMRTLAGGVIAQGIYDIYPNPWPIRTLDLPPAEVTRILGISLSTNELADLLQPLGLPCTTTQHAVTVTIPSFRQDITMLADLCEEVARVYGYERIPETLMDDALPPPDSHPELELEQRVRDMLIASGLDETITYSLTGVNAIQRLQPSITDFAGYLRLTKPISPEREYLRQSILTSLVEVLPPNLRERDRAMIFDIGRVYLPRTTPPTDPTDESAWLPLEPRHLGIALAGQRIPLHWLGTDSSPLDFFDIKGIIDMLLQRLGLFDSLTFIPLGDDERFHPGRAAQILYTHTAQQLGVFGELHPDIAEQCDIPATRVAVAELDLDTLFLHTQPPTYHPVSRYPAIVQDIALVVPQGTNAHDITHTIRQSAGPLLEHLTLFDRYTGPQIGEGFYSLTYRLVFRARDRTLSDSALAKPRTNILKALKHHHHATIRT